MKVSVSLGFSVAFASRVGMMAKEWHIPRSVSTLLLLLLSGLPESSTLRSVSSGLASTIFQCCAREWLIAKSKNQQEGRDMPPIVESFAASLPRELHYKQLLAPPPTALRAEILALAFCVMKHVSLTIVFSSCVVCRFLSPLSARCLFFWRSWWRFACCSACPRRRISKMNQQVNLTTSPGNPVVTCRVNNKYAFVELRSSEECTNALNLNGIPFMGQVRFPCPWGGRVVLSVV